ncbi:hypothetical protein ALC60_09321, partial [Trachymyrmex zeteki]
FLPQRRKDTEHVSLTRMHNILVEDTEPVSYAVPLTVCLVFLVSTVLEWKYLRRYTSQRPRRGISKRKNEEEEDDDNDEDDDDEDNDEDDDDDDVDGDGGNGGDKHLSPCPPCEQRLPFMQTYSPADVYLFANLISVPSGGRGRATSSGFCSS